MANKNYIFFTGKTRKATRRLNPRVPSQPHWHIRFPPRPWSWPRRPWPLAWRTRPLAQPQPWPLAR